jgi:hypothetical protein
VSVKPHLEYARYVARHKWFVLVAGRRTKAPLWRLAIHDWSKLTPAEWGAYVQSFYIDRHAPGAREAFNAAWLHHQHANPHHWQHWVLREDDGATLVLEMPESFAREMVADWRGAGRAITGKWDVASWYAKNRDKILLAPQTRSLVDALVRDAS